MILCENFRTASDKYGEVIAREALNSGIPDKYILAACRFHCEKPNKDFNILKVQFRQWMTYVVPNSNQDVNTMCYGEFSELLRETMAMYNTPNCLYNDGKWSLGYWNSFKEARMCPFNTKWCICHSQKDWIKYTKVKGSEFFVVNCNDKDIPMEFHHICVEIEKNGEIYFWNINDESTHCEHYPQYVSILPEHIKDIIWGESHRIGSLHFNTPYECQYQTNESKTMKYMKTNKRTITESQLRNIVTESVKKVLKESFYDDRKPFKAGELKQMDNTYIIPLIFERIPTRKTSVIDKDTTEFGFLIKPIEFTLNSFNDDGCRSDLINELIDVLQGPSGDITESKQYKHMKREQLKKKMIT